MCTYVHARYMCMHAKVDKRRPLCLPCFRDPKKPQATRTNASVVPSILASKQGVQLSDQPGQVRWAVVCDRVRKKSDCCCRHGTVYSCFFPLALYALYAGRQSFLFLPSAPPSIASESCIRDEWLAARAVNFPTPHSSHHHHSSDITSTALPSPR